MKYQHKVMQVTAKTILEFLNRNDIPLEALTVTKGPHIIGKDERGADIINGSMIEVDFGDYELTPSEENKLTKLLVANSAAIATILDDLDIKVKKMEEKK